MDGAELAEALEALDQIEQRCRRMIALGVNLEKAIDSMAQAQRDRNLLLGADFAEL